MKLFKLALIPAVFALGACNGDPSGPPPGNEIEEGTVQYTISGEFDFTGTIDLNTTNEFIETERDGSYLSLLAANDSTAIMLQGLAEGSTWGPGSYSFASKTEVENVMFNANGPNTLPFVVGSVGYAPSGSSVARIFLSREGSLTLTESNSSDLEGQMEFTAYEVAYNGGNYDAWSSSGDLVEVRASFNVPSSTSTAFIVQSITEDMRSMQSSLQIRE